MNNPTCHVVYFALGLSYQVYHVPSGRGRLFLASAEISLVLRVSQLSLARLPSSWWFKVLPACLAVGGEGWALRAQELQWEAAKQRSDLDPSLWYPHSERARAKGKASSSVHGQWNWVLLLAVPVFQLAHRGAGLLSLPSSGCCLSSVATLAGVCSWHW